MDTRSRWLWFAIVLAVIASVGIAFYRTVVRSDFPIDTRHVEEAAGTNVIDEYGGEMVIPLGELPEVTVETPPAPVE